MGQYTYVLARDYSAYNPNKYLHVDIKESYLFLIFIIKACIIWL